MLIVDDEAPQATVMAKVLHQHFAEIQTATTTRDSLAVLQTAHDEGRPFGALLVDLLLGADRGEDVIEAALEYRPRPLVVAITGAPRVGLRIVDLHPVCVVLQKPCDPDEIVYAFTRQQDPVEEFCDRHGFTGQHRRIVLEICNGHPEKEILGKLELARGTFWEHLQRIADNLGASGQGAVKDAVIAFSRNRPLRASGTYPKAAPPTGPPKRRTRAG